MSSIIIEYHKPNLMSKPIRFQLSYKRKEAEYLLPIEEELMKELHIPTRADLFKYAIRFLYKTRKSVTDVTL